MNIIIAFLISVLTLFTVPPYATYHNNDTTLDTPIAELNNHTLREVFESPIPALENLVTNGDFSVDTNADGLADNWSNYAALPIFTLTDGQCIQYTNSKGVNQYVGIQGNNYKSASNGDVILNISKAKNGTTNTTGNAFSVGVRFYNGTTALGNIFSVFTLTSNYQIFKGAIILNNVDITQIKPLILRQVNDTQIADFHADDFLLFNLTASHGVTATSGTAYDNAVAEIEWLLSKNDGYIQTVGNPFEIVDLTVEDMDYYYSLYQELIDFDGATITYLDYDLHDIALIIFFGFLWLSLIILLKRKVLN